MARSKSTGARRVDLDDRVDRRRYRCPNGHADWDRTNSHIWCRSCSRHAEQGEEIDAEHFAVVDKVTGERIAWDRITVV